LNPKTSKQAPLITIVGGRLNQTRLEINDVKITFSINIFRHFYDVITSTIGWGDTGQLTIFQIVGGRLNQTRLEINDVKITFSINIFRHFYDVITSTNS